MPRPKPAKSLLISELKRLIAQFTSVCSMIAAQDSPSIARQIATVKRMSNVFLAAVSPEQPLVSNAALPGGTMANAVSMAATTAPSTQSA
jgi:hypothetical protein